MTGNFLVTNINLYLAIEENELIRHSLSTLLDSGKLTLSIPYTVISKQNGTGNSSQFNTTLPRGIGQKLKRLIFTTYNGIEYGNFSYDHSNVNGTKVAYIQSSINSRPLTDYKLSNFNPNSLIRPANVNQPTNSFGDDYREMKKYLIGTPISNQVIYQNNWFYCDTFGLQNNSQETSMTVHDNNVNDGIDLTVGDFIYNVFVDTPFGGTAASNTGGQLIHYLFILYRRSVSINQDGTFFL